MTRASDSLLQPLWDGLLRYLGTAYFDFPLCFLPALVLVIGITGLFFSLLDCVVHKKIPAKTAWGDGARIMGSYIAAAAALYAAHYQLRFWIIPAPLEAPTLPELALQVSVFMVVGELTTYWWHRLEHGSRFVFQKVHYQHHRVTAPLTVWTNFVVHPVEGLMVMLCLYLPPLLFGAHPLVTIVYAMANTTAMVVTHSGYDLKLYPRWLFPAASAHALHHVEPRPTNLSVVMAFGDRLFGTYKAPSTLRGLPEP